MEQPHRWHSHAMDVAAANNALAGPAALLIVLVLLAATVLLVRNMDRRLKRLPREFPAAYGRARGAHVASSRTSADTRLGERDPERQNPSDGQQH